jgi:hypothetical protein
MRPKRNSPVLRSIDITWLVCGIYRSFAADRSIDEGPLSFIKRIAHELSPLSVLRGNLLVCPEDANCLLQHTARDVLGLTCLFLSNHYSSKLECG